MEREGAVHPNGKISVRQSSVSEAGIRVGSVARSAACPHLGIRQAKSGEGAFLPVESHDDRGCALQARPLDDDDQRPADAGKQSVVSG